MEQAFLACQGTSGGAAGPHGRRPTLTWGESAGAETRRGRRRLPHNDTTMRKQRPRNADPAANGLLARLEREDYDRLMLGAHVVSLKFRTRLVRQDGKIDAVYFPLSCMVSLLVTTDGRPQVEMATIGKEGVVGASELIQAQGAMGLNLVQLPGAAVRVEASAFRELLDSRPPVQKLIHQHFYALMRQILYGAACNRIHSMEERCARWLLMTHDRAGQDTFPLTQDFLSHMLGVRRATVNLGYVEKGRVYRICAGKSDGHRPGRPGVNLLRLLSSHRQSIRCPTAGAANQRR